MSLRARKWNPGETEVPVSSSRQISSPTHCFKGRAVSVPAGCGYRRLGSFSVECIRSGESAHGELYSLFSEIRFTCAGNWGRRN